MIYSIGGEYMARKDTLTKNYMRDVNIFADFFNGYIYGGKDIIKIEDLSEVDTSSIAVIPYINGSKTITIQKYRDILKSAVLMQSTKAYYLFLGIENQTDIHYAMPVRNMLYDALVYSQQVDNIAKYNREHGICEGSDEFLSGFTRDDKLIPVITVTVYWGSKPWDAPIRLKDMLTDIDDEMNELIDDIDCNLFSIIDIDKLPNYRTELNELFKLLNARNDGKALHELVTNSVNFNNISRDTAIMMSEFADVKLPRKNKEGKYNMCKAIADLEKSSADKALVEAIRNLMKNTKLSFEEICVSMGISTSDMLRYKEMI